MMLSKLNKQVSLGFIVIGLTSLCLADENVGRGFEIAARSDRTDIGFKSSNVDMKMVLHTSISWTSTPEHPS